MGGLAASPPASSVPERLAELMGIFAKASLNFPAQAVQVSKSLQMYVKDLIVRELLGWGRNPMTGVCIEQRLAQCSHKPRGALGPPKLEGTAPLEPSGQA